MIKRRHCTPAVVCRFSCRIVFKILRELETWTSSQLGSGLEALRLDDLRARPLGRWAADDNWPAGAVQRSIDHGIPPAAPWNGKFDLSLKFHS